MVCRIFWINENYLSCLIKMIKLKRLPLSSYYHRQNHEGELRSNDYIRSCIVENDKHDLVTDL